MPAELTNLPYLKDVNLSRNTTLAGNLPSASGWSQLQYFYIEQADIRGSIPTNWSGLTSLLVLSLPGNALTGALPTNMPWSALQILDLNSNQFSGDLPASWSGFTSLTNLALYSNRITGTLPSSWTSMTVLSNVTLQGNYLDRAVDHVAIVPASLQNWWNGITSKNISNQ